MKQLISVISFVLLLFAQQLSAQETYEVVAKKVDVFAQPSTDSKVIGHKVEHDIVEVYSKVDGWACIKYESTTGFVDLYCVKSLDEDEAPVPAASSPTATIVQPTTPTEVVLAAGMEVPLQAINDIKAKDVKVGQSVDFKVSRDVIVNNTVAIPFGTLVQGIVREAIKNSKEMMKMKKVRGSIRIEIDHISLPNGIVVPLAYGEVQGVKRRDYIYGGKRADVIPAGHEFTVKVASPVTISQ